METNTSPKQLRWEHSASMEVIPYCPQIVSSRIQNKSELKKVLFSCISFEIRAIASYSNMVTSTVQHELHPTGLIPRISACNFKNVMKMLT